MTTAQTIMSRDPITCSAETSTNDAAREMWNSDIGMVPVTDDSGRVVGVLTDRDIAMAAYIQGKPLSAIDVRSAMSNVVFTASPDTAVSELEKVMSEHQVRRIPVVDDGGRPIGIVSMNDLARNASSRHRANGVDPVELTNTLRAVCRPRQSSRFAAAQ